MRLREINASHDLMRLMLDDLRPGPQLTRICLAVRSPGTQPNGIIDEGIVGDLIHGTLLKLRGAMAGIPPAVAKSARVQQLLAAAQNVSGSLADYARYPKWWSSLADTFVPRGADKQPLVDTARFAGAVQKKVTPQARAMTQHQQERGKAAASDDRFNRQLGSLKRTLDRQQAIKKLLARYGVKLADASDPQVDAAAVKTAAKAGMPPQQQQAVAAGMQDIVKFLQSPDGQAAFTKFQQALQGAKTVNADVARDLLMAVTGQRLLDEGVLGDIAGMFNPHSRQQIGMQYVQRAQNKAIASMAIVAALGIQKLVRQKLAAKQRGKTPRAVVPPPTAKPAAAPAKPEPGTPGYPATGVLY